MLTPVRVQACELRGLLSQIVYLDLVGCSEDAAKETLLAGVDRGRRKPTTAPAFPAQVNGTASPAPTFPGGLPEIFQVPQRRNPNFTGREPLLEAIRNRLTSNNTAALTQAINGLGGVGKSQLALEYCYRHRSDYRFVHWIRAEDTISISTDLCELAAFLQLPKAEEREQEVIIAAVLGWLSKHDDWLLVFDNAESPEALAPYLPRSTGHLIITSRNPAWHGLAQTLPVEVMEREESVAFLEKRTGLTDNAAAARLAEALGDLPLALEQVGAYIDATGESYDGYLELFRTRRAELLKIDHASDASRDTVATTWSLSMERAGQTIPESIDLLKLCAYLSPDEISLQTMEAHVDVLPETLAAVLQDRLRRDEAVAALRKYSLVQIEAGLLSIHRLVQAVVRDACENNKRGSWAEAALRMMNDAFAYERDDVHTWAECAKLLPHTLAVVEHAERLGVAPEQTGWLLNASGLYLENRAEFSEAKVLLERALAIGEQTYGPEHPNVAIRLNNLGAVLRAEGDLAEARTLLERALAIGEQTYGSEHPEVAIRLNNLGVVLKDEGDLAGARIHFERALASDEQTYGPEHPNVAILLNNLSWVLQAEGDLAEARKHLERALAIDEQTYGPEHPAVAADLNNLAGVQSDLGDLAGARIHLKRALAISEQTYGPEHPEVATDLDNLGRVLQAEGDLAEARKHLERALVIDERFLGSEHPITVTIRRHLESLDA
jgi:tetratricopeptide (TPR) repeat protein